VTAHAEQIAGSTAGADAMRDWAVVRASTDIQYAPMPPIKPPVPPAWLKILGEWLRSIFEPLGKALGMSWPTIQYVLIALGSVMALYLFWRLVLEPLLAMRGKPKAVSEPEWTPARAAAVALLADADKLAGEGRYGEAAHLLLQRSVHHIAEARPGWLHPASTAREIAGFPMLSDRARNAFTAISTRVERSLFALRNLDADDWKAARDAYADFALAELAA
jgi:hypothetical protein